MDDGGRAQVHSSEGDDGTAAGPNAVFAKVDGARFGDTWRFEIFQPHSFDHALSGDGS